MNQLGWLGQGKPESLLKVLRFKNHRLFEFKSLWKPKMCPSDFKKEIRREIQITIFGYGFRFLFR